MQKHQASVYSVRELIGRKVLGRAGSWMIAGEQCPPAEGAMPHGVVPHAFLALQNKSCIRHVQGLYEVLDLVERHTCVFAGVRGMPRQRASGFVRQLAGEAERGLGSTSAPVVFLERHAARKWTPGT